MALTKNFKTVVEVKGVLEGPTKAFSVEFDNVEEWKAAVKTKVETERSPAANTVSACDAVLPFLQPV